MGKFSHLRLPLTWYLLKPCIEVPHNKSQWLVLARITEIPDKSLRGEKKDFSLVLHNSVVQFNYCTNFALLQNVENDLRVTYRRNFSS